MDNTDTVGARSTAELLTGWKAIAQHFGRTQSTVRRWANTADLPVYRAAGEKGLSVYAYTSELDAWLTRRRAETVAAELDQESDRTVEKESSGSPASSTRPSRLQLARQVAPVLVLLAALGVGLALVHYYYHVRFHGASAMPVSSAAVPREARELYLHGTYLWNRRNPAGIARAIETLQEAVALYPDYAEAHAGLAMAYNLARQYSDMSGWEAYPKAEAAARRAIDLDPGLYLAHSALAFVEFHWHWQVEAGLARFEEALGLKPDAADTLMWYANALLLAGRPHQALPVIDRAQSLNPDHSAVVNMKAQVLFYSGQVDEALDLVITMMAKDPNHAWSYHTHSFIQLSREQYADYLASYARLGDLIGVPRYRVAAEAGAAALADGGVEAMAMAMFAVEREFYERGEALAWDLARHQAMLNNSDEALRWLHISLKRKEERLIGIKADPCFWPIRDDPGYQRLLADIGFPPEP